VTVTSVKSHLVRILSKNSVISSEYYWCFSPRCTAHCHP